MLLTHIHTNGHDMKEELLMFENAIFLIKGSHLMDGFVVNNICDKNQVPKQCNCQPWVNYLLYAVNQLDFD